MLAFLMPWTGGQAMRDKPIHKGSIKENTWQSNGLSVMMPLAVSYAGFIKFYLNIALGK
jgi:hypothetical protein